MTTSAYQFRSATEADVPPISRWRNAARLIELWGKPDGDDEPVDTRWGRAVPMERWAHHI